MTETTEKEDKKRLGLSRPGKLVLNKTVETGQVRQSFSRGRSKSVTVEVRKKRTYMQGADGRMKKVAADAQEPEVETEVIDHTAEEVAAGAKTPTLTDHEKAVRARALEDARKAEEEAKIRAVEEAERRAREEAEAAERAKREA